MKNFGDIIILYNLVYPSFPIVIFPQYFFHCVKFSNRLTGLLLPYLIGFRILKEYIDITFAYKCFASNRQTLYLM